MMTRKRDVWKNENRSASTGSAASAIGCLTAFRSGTTIPVVKDFGLPRFHMGNVG